MALGVALFAAALAPATARADQLPVVLDGVFDDWTGVAPAWQDPSGDGGGSGVDFGRLWLADDTRFFYLRFESGAELSLDENNSLVLYLDTDANSSTGLQVGGIGAELEWKLGQRFGTYRYGGQSFTVHHNNLGFVALPTVTATGFEAAFGRNARPDGSHSLFLGPTLRILLRDTSTGGDWLPDSGQILSYTLDQGTLPPEVAIPLGKRQAADLRILSWNVHNDGPWDGGLQPKFGRVIRAVAPEILNLEEIYNHTPQQTAALIESWLPSGEGEAWHGAGNNDCITVSRYPVLGTWPIDGNLAVLLNTVSAIGKPLLVINAHLPCCTDDSGRQAEVDHILSFLRDAKEPGGLLTLDPDTPFMIVGDMNFVGFSQQLTSLLTGDIVNEGQYGPDFHPDWDGTALADLISRQTELRMAYTWRSDTSTFWSGRLDFMIYTDAVLAQENNYVLYTPEMSADSLAAHGLQSGDNPSDHIVHVADFRPAAPVSVEGWEGVPGPAGPADPTEPGGAYGRTGSGIRWQVSPNPSSRSATVRLDLARPASVRLDVFDPSGRLVASPTGGLLLALPSGSWRKVWDGTDLAGHPVGPGAYFMRLSGKGEGGEFTRSLRWIRVR